MLVSKGMDAGLVTEEALPVGEAFRKLVEFTGETPAALTRTLYETHQVGLPWTIFAFLGVLSAVLIWGYGRWFRKFADSEKQSRQAIPTVDSPSDPPT